MVFSFKGIRARTLSALIEKYGQEEIMEAMGVPITGKRFTSPFREDKHPTCSLIYIDEKLYFRDWAVHDRSLDIVNLYMHLYHCSFPEAVNGLWDLMEGKQRISTPHRPRIKVQGDATSMSYKLRDWHSQDIRWWRSYGVNKQLLDWYEVYPVRQLWLNDYTIYQYINERIKPAYLFELPGVIKVYFPFGKPKSFHTSVKGLFGYKQLPVGGDMLVITKSAKDVMCLAGLGVYAVSPMAETVLPDTDLLKELESRFKRIVVLFDNDHAGIAAMRKYKKLGYRIMMLPRHKAKDISDYYFRYGKALTEELAKQAITFINNNNYGLCKNKGI